MADETPSQTPPPQTPSSLSSSNSSASSFQPTWQLPPGIEHHLEAFTLKAIVGGTVGAVAGALIFRSGRGANAAAGMAFGVGCAMGSFLERGLLSRERGEMNVDPRVPKFGFLTGSK
eukprot:CAMPEP_0171328322 /NCGR_PEP_ID=MMETSP0878-20121228/586_1 /TAXON_ID=67004 /ORGANISM="Thalassiosira weissflogii, Strain CCMP1336" /LENGTH=116 /DNA_ID=CAMNT_0011828169 /DNA_START=43 /DNA_END=393 /DNA_ORIENTATION=+